MSSVPRGESLEVNPLCLVFFVDDTGHETFADPKYPVFGLGGCAMMASHLDIELRAPWRAMKAESFGGPDVPLHASKLREARPSQIAAIAEFFQKGRFQRFASVVHNTATLPAGIEPLQVLAGSLIERFKELAMRWAPRPQQVCFVHEASQRGDALLERYIGKLTVKAGGREIPVRQGLMEKRLGDPALEVADFVINAAGGQAHHWSRRRSGFRRDFQAVFHVPGFLTSFLCIDAVEVQQRPLADSG
jgi:hypothetical protein